jgi:FkbM family methyltransferase
MESQKIMAKLDRVLNDLDFIKNRMSSYLSDGVSLTYLADETPIYVNANDDGCSSNFINGGKYEEENSRILNSFVKPDSVFLDIGANLGVFSLKVAPRLKGGKVLAFEPNPAMVTLLKRSIFLNGYANIIQPHAIALSDSSRADRIRVPKGHAGGGGFAVATGGDVDEFACDARKLDDIVPNDFTCDLVKIDVEGHELSVLKGMEGVIARSAPRIKILFEKLGSNAGSETGLYELLRRFNLDIYRIQYPTRLAQVTLHDFMLGSGYFLAANRDQVEGRVHRGFFRIYPAQLNILAPYSSGPDNTARIRGTVAPNSVALHGPYWHLPRGYHRLRLEGRVASRLNITVAERFGYPVRTFPYPPSEQHVDFPIERDLCKFELIIRSVDNDMELDLEHILIEMLE